MEMPQTPNQAESTALHRIKARAREQEDSNSALVRFIGQFFAGVAPEDLAERTVDDLYGAVISQWRLLQRRKRGERLVRIINPHAQEHGWQSSHTIIEVVQDDMPFLVDSARLELNRHGLTVHLIVHPVIRVKRDRQGQLIDVLPQDEKSTHARQESLLYIEVDRQTNSTLLENIKDDLNRVFDDVAICVEDWQPMRETLRGIVKALQQSPPPLNADALGEDLAFLKWLDQDHFTYIGYRQYLLDEHGGDEALRLVPHSGLGILRDEGATRFSRSFSRLEPAAKQKAREPGLLILTKSNSRATVHRPGYLDYIGIKQFDANGTVTGEHRFLGLYTSAAYIRRATDIPMLRGKVQYVMKHSGLRPRSHSSKAMLHILETLPRDELFQCTGDQLLEIATRILELQERQRVRVIVRPDTFGRFVSCLVYVPRDKFNTDARERIQTILVEAFAAEELDFNVWLTESVLARLHVVLHVAPGRIPAYDENELQRQIAATVRTWDDELHEQLGRVYGEEQGNRLFARYRHAFPASYRGDYDAGEAVADIEKIESVHNGNTLGMALYHPPQAPANKIRFKVFRAEEPVSLSIVLPLLENMGLRVVDERPHRIRPAGKRHVWLHDIGMLYDYGDGLDAEKVRQIFQDAFAKIWHNITEDDRFNSLILRARMTWREVVIIRACAKYLRQAGFPFSQSYVEQALNNNPQIARMLIDLFLVKFDPEAREKAGPRSERISEAILRSLDEVPVLDEDRILRRFFLLIQSMVRTNHFQRNSDGHPKNYLSFKLDPAQLPDLEEPRPRYEIFVFSPRVEGVHLRGGKVARGGIRWSDRLEDFRTEVFGLMKAQMVKNAVIVPVGAKGGFVMKAPPPAADREATRNEVLYCYRTFIRGLLDLTDNLVDGEPRAPDRLVCYDDADPYLVVAADKGTATFSDTANEIATEYDFWLGDAFASGGSSGYDHKKMGITARGVWESVKRHFHELDKDIQREAFTVVGIGDMAGDVFGNGMLLSPYIKLLAAFNHREIFLDPDPDPASSYKERQRLFALPHSNWSDYNHELISPGGGVYARTAKSIPLSEQVREALQIDASALTPNELINALLRAPVELLWNGGIGTFVKASFETDDDADDRSNDAIRIDANQLRCKVVGEGGNLGLTYAARIEFALHGGYINTDFIDNSGGVDCSDHEVNIKVLLDQLIARGALDATKRDALLEEMTDEVAALVLANNYLQSQSLALSAHFAPQLLDEHSRLIRTMERNEVLDRRTWLLPDEQALESRRAAKQGLTRPELAVLLAHSKIELYQQLLRSGVLEKTTLRQELPAYFPGAIARHFGDQVQTHRLAREIIATHISNNMINRMGLTFAARIQEHSGAEAGEIACVYTAIREIFKLRGLWRAVEELDNKIATRTQMSMLNEIRKLCNRTSLWMLRHEPMPTAVGVLINNHKTGISDIAGALDKVLSEEDATQRKQNAERYEKEGVPPSLAMDIASLAYLFSALDIVSVARRADRPPVFVAGVFHRLGAELGLHWLRDSISALSQDEHWARLARSSLRDDQYRLQAQLVEGILHTAHGDAGAEALIDHWRENNTDALDRFEQRMNEFKTASADVALVSVALNEVRKLIQRSGEA